MVGHILKKQIAKKKIIATTLSAAFVCMSLYLSGLLVQQLVLAQSDQVVSISEIAPEKSNKQLKGEVEQVDDDGRIKNIQSDDEPNLTPGKAVIQDSKSGYLQGHAQMGELDPAKEDPDAEDRELMIAWDRWRNRFLQAVLGSTTEMLNNDQARSFQINPYTHTMEPVYPVGTSAWFVCEVNRDRQIKRLRILTSSGYPDYDRAVLEAVQALQGSSLLRFPTGSRRMAVLQGGAVERATRAQQQYFQFGDMERYRVPAY